ncbi:hypothetical protein BO78DRAFT_395704 [Aspergillus sclerotiicarbonarius CBS 121057]|uniref:DUF7730 domain-containing protein n=1 Tax=Aspergillus sclerotiicarbonarius (strain CBS 121057 / IBT 28362) TaxID=1448318 RepID=A0A319EVC4_ASPSB|nr:hypothetical protein BO78DRAFT_395704 [Aspergillus sclerotiicarbonarius CBS 121057]
MQRITSWLEERGEARKYQKHPANQPPRNQRHNPPRRPQPTGSFFTPLPLEIRLQIYSWLFGHRSLHYVNWWNEAQQEWETFHRACTCSLNTIVDDVCVSNGKAGLEEFRTHYEGFDAWVDIALMLTCWQAYTEALPVLYTTNEFCFKCPLTLTTAFPRQTPRPAPAFVRHLTFRWELYYNRHPHLSPENRDAYTRVWRLLTSTYPHLKELRIGIYAHWWREAKFDDAGQRLPSTRALLQQQQRQQRQRHNDGGDDTDELAEYQDAWLEGLEWTVDHLSDLVVFQVAVHVDIYHRLRARVKPFLADRARQRSKQHHQKDNPGPTGVRAISYRMWKSPDDRILTGNGDTRPLSAGSSNQGIDLRPNFWVKWKGKWIRQARGRLDLSRVS